MEDMLPVYLIGALIVLVWALVLGPSCKGWRERRHARRISRRLGPKSWDDTH